MKRFLTLFGLLALLFAVGCEDTPPEPVTPQEQNLSLNHSELAFTAEGGSVQVVVTATDSWSATGGAEWSSLSATEGEGDATLTVTAAAVIFRRGRNLSWGIFARPFATSCGM